MRICFYSTDTKVAEIASRLEGIDVTMASGLDEVQECVNSSEEKVILFIDIDDNKSEAEFVNFTLYEDNSVIRIIITEKASIKELKKHQMSDVSAYGYIKKPLTGELIANLVNNFEMADYVEENNLVNEGDKAVDQTELTFVGLKPDMNAEASEEEEEDDEVFEAAPMEMPRPSEDSAGADSDDEEDMDNILEFGSGSEEEVDTENATATDIQDPPEEEEEEVKLSHEETKVLEKHGVLNENWKVTYESDLNEKIQAKFDRVFSEAAGGLPDFEMSEPTLEADDDDIDMDESTGESDVANISLDLGADEEATDESPSLDSMIEDDEPEEVVAAPSMEMSSPSMDLSDEEYLEESTKQDILAPEEEEIAAVSEEEATGEFDVEEMMADGSEEPAVEEIQEPEETPQTSEVSMTDHDDGDDILEEEDGLDLGDDEVEGAELLASDGPSPSEDLDLGDDDDGELDLGGADDVAAMAVDSAGDGDLDLGDDMDLDLSAEEVEATNASIDMDGDLDLDAMDEIDVSDVDDEPMGDMDFDSIDEETAEVETLEASSDDEEDALDFGGDDDDGIDDEATVATMLFSNDGATKEALDAAKKPEEISAGGDDDVDLASLIEDEDDEEDVGFSVADEDDDEDGMTETLLGASDDDDDDHTGDATETLVSSAEVDDDATQPTMIAPAPQAASTFSPSSGDETIEITPPERRVASAYNEDELMRLQATIRQLREERDGLLKDINDLKTDKKLVEQENLGLKAELDEVKIELTIVKKRHQDEIEEMNYRNRLADEKKAISEEKSRQMQKEFDRLSQKVRIDFNQVKQREKELESQLELVSMDSESQVRSRDMKILELKRKIDQLEFNMENSVIKESKAREDKVKIEEKLAKIMKTLRGSIQVLEDDLELDEELIEKIKKV